MEQLEKVEVVVEVAEGGGLGGSKGGIAPVDDALEVGGRDLGGRDVQRQDLVGEVGEGQVLPGLPVIDLGDVLRNEQAAVAGEAFEDDLLEREL